MGPFESLQQQPTEQHGDPQGEGAAAAAEAGELAVHVGNAPATGDERNASPGWLTQGGPAWALANGHDNCLLEAQHDFLQVGSCQSLNYNASSASGSPLGQAPTDEAS